MFAETLPPVLVVFSEKKKRPATNHSAAAKRRMATQAQTSRRKVHKSLLLFTKNAKERKRGREGEIYRALCHWLHNWKIYTDISITHLLHIYIYIYIYVYIYIYIFKASRNFVNQYYNLDTETEMCAARYLSYIARVFIFQSEIFPYLFWVDFFIARTPENSRAGTKFEVKCHFTIRAGHIARARRRIKFVFFRYQYLQNFSVSDQNPGIVATIKHVGGQRPKNISSSFQHDGP